MRKRAWSVAASVCFILLNFLYILSPAYADVAVVTPEGTIGTTFTIAGDDFGTKRGTVFIGSKPCQVLEWDDTNIQCLINVPLPPGEYDVRLNLHGNASKVILYQAFTMRPPQLNPPLERPQFVVAGDVVTVEGEFLAGQKGLNKVEIESLDGDKRPCRLLEGGMDYITFELPSGIPGCFHLRYTNPVGTTVQPYWGTFAEPPELPGPVVGSDHGGHASKDTAAAVSYNNKLWVFWPATDADDNEIQYRRWDGENWGDVHKLNHVSGTETSYAQLTPIVVHNTLYIFITGTNYNLYYDTYNAGEVDSSKAWTHNLIPNAKMYSHYGRFAAVWNFTKNCIEVYWTPNTTDIYMKTLDVKTNQWSANRKLTITRDPAHPTVAPYLTAVFNQIDAETEDYVTYLSWADGDGVAGAVTEMKDGVELTTTRNTSWKSVNKNRGPSLADLGERYLAVLYNDGGYISEYWKYDKIQHTPVGYKGVMGWSNQETDWTPNGVVFSRKVDDSTSPTGYRMDTKFYALVEDNNYVLAKAWELWGIEYLGYWMPVDDGSSVDMASGVHADFFPYWSLIGLIDMPPFVRNGNGPCTNAELCVTSTELNFSNATTNGLSGEYSAGGFIGTRSRSPVVFEAGAGYSGGFENSVTYSHTVMQSIEGNLDGRIVAFYLAPAFDVYTLEWNDLSGASTTGTTTKSLVVTGATIMPAAFEPEVGPESYTGPTPYFDPSVFPIHNQTDDRERLASYNIDPTDDLHGFESVFESASYWGASSPGGWSWSIDQEKSIDHGFYVDLKFGYKFSKVPIAVGVKGSVEIQIHTKTQIGVEAITKLRNLEPIDEDPSRVTSFYATGYWLKPSEKGYWLPESRKGMGDTPWFITYMVTMP